MSEQIQVQFRLFQIGIISQNNHKMIALTASQADDALEIFRSIVSAVNQFLVVQIV